MKALFLSGKNGTEIRREIEGNTTLLKLIMTPSTYYFYVLFSDPTNKVINTAISIVIIVSLTAVMTSLGKQVLLQYRIIKKMVLCLNRD